MGFQSALEGAVRSVSAAKIAKGVNKPQAPSTPTMTQQDVMNIVQQSQEKYDQAMKRLEDQMKAYQSSNKMRTNIKENFKKKRGAK